MLDIRFVRENTESVAKAMRDRGMDFSLDAFLQEEKRRREILLEVEELRKRRNVVSEEIGRLKKEKKDASAQLEEMKGVGAAIRALDESLRELDEKTTSFLLEVPNIPHESVPVGSDENSNVEVRRRGEPRRFDFEPLNHWDLGEMLGIIDFERAARIAGSRFSLLKGQGAKLERALMNFMLDLNTGKGYTEVFPPILVNRQSMTGTGQLPKFEEELFRVADPDLFLIPTAEVPVTNIHRDEILKEQDLPIYYTAYTPCFRREAGSHGKDTRGLIRLHQFNKVEFVKFVLPETSYEELRGGHPHAARPPLPHHCPLHGRPGLRRIKDLRPGGLASGPAEIPGDILVFELRKLSGQKSRHPLQTGRQEGYRIRPHPERLRACHRENRGGHPGELPGT
jgi:seryl-tRNA synthetase